MTLFSELKRRNVLRVAVAYLAASWFLIQVIETLFPVFGLSDALVKIAVILLAIGFPLVLIFSWLYELTPEGLKREKDIDRSASVVHYTGKKLDRAIIVVLTLALGYFAFDKFVLAPARDVVLVEEATEYARTQALVESYGENSIAVLPFVNMSDDKANEYFSDGISEELLNLLAKIPKLRVISRSSAFAYKGKDINLTEIARELNVAHILEGSVRKAGNQVRITVQLIEARSDTHLWSATYDHTLNDIFAIQDEIAAKVVNKLQITLLNPVPVVKETDPKAYSLYLQARHTGLRFTPEAFEQSNVLYQQALDIDPEYGAAWNGLAGNYANQTGDGLRPYEEGLALAREAANTALATDADQASALANLGWLAMRFDNDLAKAAQHLERALQLEPTSIDVLGHAAGLVERLGRLDEAIVLSEYVVARDPVSSVGHANLGVYRLYAGRLDEAITSYRTALNLSPGFLSAQYAIGVALLLKGEPLQALAAFEQEMDEEYRIKGTAMAQYDLGRTTEYAEALAILRERWGDEWPAEVAHVYAWTGDVDAAFEWLRKDLETGQGSGWAESALDPLLSKLHDDRRWQPMLAEVGVSREQLAAIGFEVRLPE